MGEDWQKLGAAPVVRMNDLVPWIEQLHGRLERGELRDRGPVTIGGGAPMSAAMAAGIMLSDLERRRRLPTARRHDPATLGQQRRLLEGFRQLREQIG